MTTPFSSSNDGDCVTPPQPPSMSSRWSKRASCGDAGVGDSETTAETTADHETFDGPDTAGAGAVDGLPPRGAAAAAAAATPSSPPPAPSPMAPSPSVFARIGASLLLSQDNLIGTHDEAMREEETTHNQTHNTLDVSKFDSAPELPFVADSAENTPRVENLYHPPDIASRNDNVYRKQYRRLERPAYRARGRDTCPTTEEDIDIVEENESDLNDTGGSSSMEVSTDTESQSGRNTSRAGKQSAVVIPPPPLTAQPNNPSIHRAHDRLLQSHRQGAQKPIHSRRILDRDGGFAQSRGRWAVGNASWLSDSLALAEDAHNTSRQRDALSRLHGSPSDDDNDNDRNSTNDSEWVEVSSNVSFDEEDGANQSQQCCLSRFFCCLTKRRPRRHRYVSRLHASPLRRCWNNWYHSLAYTPTIYLMMILFLVYAGTIVFFALVYLGVSHMGGKDTPNGGHSSFCGLDLSTLTEALYFSLSTQTTIGYGVSDYYFGDCWTPFLLVLCQVFVAITYDAVAIGLLFTRMSRGQKRGRTIIFSDVACIRKVRGKHFLLFRVGELTRNRSIIAAKVMVHCVRHERHPIDDTDTSRSEQIPIITTHYQTHHVHLQCPDESVGAPLLLSLPHVCVHALDGMEGNRSSPLVPQSPVWYDSDGCANAWPPKSYSTVERNDDPNDSTSKMAASRVGAAGAAGAAAGLLLAGPLIAAGAGVAAGAGAAYAAASKVGSQSKLNGKEASVAGGSKEDGESKGESSSKTTEAVDFVQAAGSNNTGIRTEAIKHFLSDRKIELIVLVEGIDEMTGSAVQARHSYRYDDIVYDATFAPCVYPRREIDCDEAETENDVRGAGTEGENPLTTPLLDDEEMGALRTRERQQSRRTRGPSSSATTACYIDFSKFHQIVSVPSDSRQCPYVPDWA